MRALVALGCGLALLAPAAAGGAIGDPPVNRTLSEATRQACGASSTGQACQSAGLADLNAARAAEGVGPMQLPADMRFLELIHAEDERLPVEAVEFGTRAIERVLQRF